MSSKPTLLPSFIANEDASFASDNKKAASSAKLIRDAQKESQQEAVNMTDDEIAEEVAKLKKKGASDEEIVVDPSTFKFKLDAAQKKEFLATLTPEQKAAVKEWHADVDYLANVPVPKAFRPQSAYFLFGAHLREKLKNEDIKLGVTEFANRLKDDWASLGESGQEKFEKLREKEIKAHESSNANLTFLKQAQKAAVKFYSKILGDIPDPSSPEATENHGVAWTAHFKEAHIKKMLLSTPGWEGAVSKDVSRVVAAATEAMVVWFGQQLAARTVRAKRKTVSGAILKAYSTEEPHASYLSRVPAIKAIKLVEEKEEKPKKEKAEKAEKPKKAEKKADPAAGSMKKFLGKKDGVESDEEDSKKPSGPKKRKQAPVEDDDEEAPKSPVKKQKGNKATQ